MKKQLSVVLPACNEGGMIFKAAQTLHEILTSEKIPYQIVFVDDGSKDETWNNIVKCQQEYTDENAIVSGVHFSRNFGKESAMMAGLQYATGDCCVVMDCDLQHPPIKVVEMYRLWEQGYEVVEGVKADRGKESKLHALCAGTFYNLMSKATGIDMKRASDFKLLDRKAVLVLVNMKERNAFFRALSSWVGFRTTNVEFCVEERTEGVSKWSTWSLIKYAITNVTSFSTAPMQLVTILGAILFAISFIFGSVALIQKFMGIAADGFTTVILLLLLTNSIIMVSIGIIGYYIAQIYEEIKERPRFIVSETCNL